MAFSLFHKKSNMSDNHYYAKGFTISSKKKGKEKNPITRDIIGSRDFDRPLYLEMLPETETQLSTESSTVTVPTKDLPETETQLLTKTATSTVSTRNLPEVFKSEMDSDEDYSDFAKPPAAYPNAEWIIKKSHSLSKRRRWSGTMFLKTHKKKNLKSASEPTPRIKPSMISSVTQRTPKKQKIGCLLASVTPSPHKKGEIESQVSGQQIRKPSVDNQQSIMSYLASVDTPAKKKENLLTTDRFKSRRPGYGVKWRDAMPGDLVMAFASDIEHPAVKEGIIHRNYILLGIVKSFVNVKWGCGIEDEESGWDGVTWQERLKVFWGDVNGWDAYSCNQPGEPRNDQVKVIALKRGGNLAKINPQFKEMIDEQWEFVNGG